MVGDENGDFPSHRRYIVIYPTWEVNPSPRFDIVRKGEDLTLHVENVEGNHRGPRHPLMSTTRFHSCRLVGPPSAEVCRTAANFA